jgi:hypothetical protein
MSTFKVDRSKGKEDEEMAGLISAIVSKMEMDWYSILLVYIDAKRSMPPTQKAPLALLFFIFLAAVVLPIFFMYNTGQSQRFFARSPPSCGLCSGFWPSHCRSLYQEHRFARIDLKPHHKLGTQLDTFKNCTDAWKASVFFNIFCFVMSSSGESVRMSV